MNEIFINIFQYAKIEKTIPDINKIIIFNSVVTRRRTIKRQFEYILKNICNETNIKDMKIIQVAYKSRKKRKINKCPTCGKILKKDQSCTNCTMSSSSEEEDEDNDNENNDEEEEKEEDEDDDNQNEEMGDKRND